jgi:hypothetical protein
MRLEECQELTKKLQESLEKSSGENEPLIRTVKDLNQREEDLRRVMKEAAEEQELKYQRLLLDINAPPPPQPESGTTTRTTAAPMKTVLQRAMQRRCIDPKVRRSLNVLVAECRRVRRWLQHGGGGGPIVRSVPPRRRRLRSCGGTLSPPSVTVAPGVVAVTEPAADPPSTHPPRVSFVRAQSPPLVYIGPNR